MRNLERHLCACVCVFFRSFVFFSSFLAAATASGWCAAAAAAIAVCGGCREKKFNSFHFTE